jgi:2-amino-4-hydroxy-6-hydroxymethyldihydropteridine diphosphokinase
MSPIPRPHVRMPSTPRPSPAEGSQIALPEGDEGRFATPQGDAGRGTDRAGEPVVLALGSNLGNRVAILSAAMREIAAIDGLELTGASDLYESAAVKPGGVDLDAPTYLNAVVTAFYTGEPHTLLAAVNRIEADHGRERSEHWGDRTLDIDIVTFGALISSDETLTVPHPRAAERDFVLAPWLQIDPDALLPGRGRVRDLLAALDTTVRVYAGGDR